MATHQDRSGYSADVRLSLECGDTVMPLAQVAPDWIIPVQARDLPPTTGTVVISVDGRQHRHGVFLPRGMSHNSIQVAIESRASDAALA